MWSQLLSYNKTETLFSFSWGVYLEYQFFTQVIENFFFPKSILKTLPIVKSYPKIGCETSSREINLSIWKMPFSIMENSENFGYIKTGIKFF